MLHQAPCSVLIARAPVGSQPFPRSIVVGVDGSPQAVAALAAARELSERLEAPLTVVAAAGEKSVDLDAVRELGVAAEEDRGKPVPSLVERSKKADLLVVGSRGLHGLKALGSVSERVAHQAGCSVLVIR
jgi:nucleotide-binding universal stress UspA family protein